MIISHKHKFIFIAIPKTGTHTIRELLRPYLDKDDIEQCILYDKRKWNIPELNNVHHGHLTCQEIKTLLLSNQFDDYFKFTFVRDPLKRFISTYFSY